MDAVFRCFIQASKQYHAHPSEENIDQVLRQFDVLMGQTSSGSDLQFFDPRNLMVVECLRIMVDLLLDMKPRIVQKLFFLLANLGSCPQLQESLSTQLHLHNSLAVFLQAYGTAENDTLFIQCLKLLDVFTYHAALHSLESPIEFLLNYIFKEIQSDFPETLISCLGILSNLCRNSSEIVTYIKSLPNYRRIIEHVLAKLSCTFQPVLIHSMIILHMLTQGETVSKMVFSEKNLSQAVEMVVKVCSTEDSSTQRAASDLLTALLITPEYQKWLARSNQLDSALCSIWQSLQRSKPASASNLLRLLESLFSVGELRSKVVNALVSQNEENTFDILTLLGEWGTRTDNTVFIHRVDSLAFKVLTRVLEELLHQKKSQNYLEVIPSILANAITQNLERTLNFESSNLKLQLDKIYAILELVSLLSKFEETRPLLNNLKASLLKGVVDQQIKWDSLCTDQDCSEASMEVVLLSLTVSYELGSDQEEMRDVFLDIVKDKTMYPLLASGLSSCDQKQVHRALCVVCNASRLISFPTQLLSEAITAGNKMWNGSLIYETESNKSVRVLENSPERNERRRQTLDNSVELVISRLESGLEIKDLKCTEIMEMYENKVDILVRQMQELQKTIEAKSSALQQCDKLLTQYRCLQAQHEAEFLKLRSLLKESERKRELEKDHLKEIVSEKRKIHEQLKVSEEMVLRLKAQHDELAENHMELTQRLKAAEQQVEELHASNNNMREINIVLQKQNDTFQQKQDVLNEEVKSLADEKRGLTKQVKDKEIKVKDLGAALDKCRGELQEKEEALAASEAERLKLKQRLCDSEKKKTDLAMEVSSFHKLCTQHQNALLEKEQEIKVLSEKYTEQKKLTEQIMCILKQNNK